MSLETNRASIVGAVEAAKAAWGNFTVEIEYDNRFYVDLALQVNPYLMVDIIYNDSEQMDLGKQPMVCDYGWIVFAAGVKEGSGSTGLLALLQHFRSYLELKDNLGTVRTHVAKLTKPNTVNGFYYQPMMVPFWEQHLSG